MLDQHKSHLVSTYTTVMQHLAEIRQVVSSGESPTGSHLTPLPGPTGERLLSALGSVAGGLEDMLQSFVPNWQVDAGETVGLAAALMWVSILLQTVEELVRDLLPSRMGRKYGPLQRTEAERLQGRVDRVLASVRQAITILEELSDPAEQP
jgi:hypothetical protein